MVVAEIYISQGVEDHRFIIDGETVSENSPMTAFRHRPFEEWKSLLIEELVEECNRDYFCLKVSADNDQYNYLFKQAEECELCKECLHVNGTNKVERENSSPKRDECTGNIWAQMDQLFEKNGNRLAPTRKLNFGLLISDSTSEEYIKVIESLVSCGFSKAGLNLRRGYFNISLEEIDEDDLDYFEGDVFAYKSRSKNSKIIDLCCDPEMVGKKILHFIEIQYVNPFMSNNKEKNKQPEEKVNQTSAETLNFTISLPEKLDKGQSSQIVIIGAPRAIALKHIQCEIENPEVISYENGKITALKAGTATIKFKIIGKLEYISKHQITVIEHILVNKIELNQTSLEGLVNDTFKLTAVCFPEIAENVDDLKYESLTPEIVRINQNGEIQALQDGIGRVRAYVGNIEAIATVNIGSRVNEIKLSKENIKLYLGETERVQISIKPNLYTEESLNVRNNNEDIAIYKNGKVIAKGIGETDIVFNSKNSSVSAKIHVKVNSTFQKRNYSGVPVQIGIALFVVALVCIFILGKSTYGVWAAIGGTALCVLSLVIDKRDRLFSVVFALLNAGLLFFIFR